MSEKLTVQCPLRFSETDFTRLETACDKTRERPPAFIRRIVLAELDRTEARGVTLTAKQAALLKKIEALEELQADPEALLDEALQKAGEPLLKSA